MLRTEIVISKVPLSKKYFQFKEVIGKRYFFWMHE